LRLTGMTGFCIALIVAAFAADAATATVSTNSVAAPPAGQATAIFAGGCFWCEEAAYMDLPGVISVTSGYTGGQKKKDRKSVV